MKTVDEIIKILDSAGRVNVHVHTHLCDGAADMTVENIASEAKKHRIGAVVLVPHFHRKLSDKNRGEELYTDTDEGIFLRLRDEIEAYAGHGEVRFLLSTETDILSVAGDLSLTLSPEAERALDLITPTMNFNPLLPLRMVALTNPKTRDGLHRSGEFEKAAAAAGGLPAVLEAIYRCEEQAILHSPYPCMLGHFFSAHSLNTDYSWFDMRPEHLPLMEAGARKVIDACGRMHAPIDITGLVAEGMTAGQKMKKDGFLYDFQRRFIDRCRAAEVPVYPGSDAHRLARIGLIEYYYQAFSGLMNKTWRA